MIRRGRRAPAFWLLMAAAAAACAGESEPLPEADGATPAAAALARRVITHDEISGLRPGRHVPLPGPWHFRIGDDPSWASPHVDDSGWALVDPGRPLPDSIRRVIRERERAGHPGVAWFRYRLTVDPALHGRALGLFLDNSGAMEIYLDGQRVHTFGVVDRPGAEADVRMAWHHPANTLVLNRTESVIAVRMNLASAESLLGRLLEHSFRIGLESPESQAARNARSQRENAGWILVGGTLGALGLVHLLLYGFLRKPLANLYFGLFAFATALGLSLSIVMPAFTDDARLIYRVLFYVAMPAQLLALPALLAFLYATFRGTLPRWFWLAPAAVAVFIVLAPLLPTFFFQFIGALLFSAVSIDGTRLVVHGVRQRLDGARIIGAGFLVLAGVLLYYAVMQFFTSEPISQWLPMIGFGAVALSGSIYLARNSARASRELEELTDHLEEQVVERTRDLELARAAAESANQTKSQFLANMSHELRTPLNAIIGYSEMLVEEAEDLGQETFVPDLRRIHTSGRHLLGLINDVLDLSKIEAGRMELYVESLSVEAVVRDVAATVEPLVAQKENRLAVVVDPDAGEMAADQVKVRQILFNLLSNATKFTEAGSITLSVQRTPSSREGEWIVFEIADTGIGMTTEQLERLFQPFTQADASTTKKYGGTGLGLTITRRFAEMMGGTIDVRSAVGEGTRFTVRLPVHVEAGAAPDAQGGAGAGVPEVPGAPARATVLLIDDDPSARDMISRMLVRDGCRVITAADGMEGLRLAREHRPDLITLDVMMRGLDGWAVLSQLKADPDLASIPVVIVTVVDDRNLGFALGANEYLTKPIDRERLIHAVHRVLPHPSAGPVLVVEDEPATRSMLRRILEKERCEVIEASNGREALERAAGSPPALVLLDLMMPEMDGFAFLQEFRRSPQGRHTPVVVLTAKDLTERERQQLHGAVARVLQKGEHSGEQVLAEVRRQLARVVPAAPAGG
jgi:signal transduction histidine kinase/CheY-like chemotaxis protein